jgi:hypothetical protein
MSAVLLLAALAATSTSAESVATATSARQRDGARWYAIPNFAYDTDDGVGFGARGELAIDEPGFEPYKTAYVLHVFFTSRGYMHHRIRIDRTHFGPGGRFRFTAHLAWRQWLNDGYWGIGDQTTIEQAYAGGFGSGDPREKRYRYTLLQPFAHLTFSMQLDGPWRTFFSLNGKWSLIRTYPGSLLLDQRPYGIDGGPSLQFSAGILFDTRRPEVSPREGVLLELSARGVPELAGGSGRFAGVLASARAFFSLGQDVIFATRLMGEELFGKIPFYEMVHWGGAVPVTGFGGFETLRGIPFGRWRAPGKAILNTELRIHVLEHRLFGESMVWEVAPYFDAGAVFDSGDLAIGPQDAPLIHPGFGGGIRAIYAEAFVGRLDSGVGLDWVRAPDGTVSSNPEFGLYVVFDHPF